jgi:hypothetical protein
MFVGVVDALHDSPLGLAGGSGGRAVHRAEAREEREARLAEAPRLIRVVVHDHVHVGAQPEAARIEPGGGARRPRQVDGPAQAGGIGAHGEGDLIRESRGDLDDLRARRGHVDGHLRVAARTDPLNPRARGLLREAEAVEVAIAAERHLVSPQIPLELLGSAPGSQATAHGRDGRRRVATAVPRWRGRRDRVDGGDGGGDGGVAREGIGDAGAEPDAPGLAGRHSQPTWQSPEGSASRRW